MILTNELPCASVGILKRGGKVYVKVIEDTKRTTLMPIMTRKILLDSVVYTDCYRSYNTLDVEGFLHHRVNHSTHLHLREDMLCRAKTPSYKWYWPEGPWSKIFWSQAKRVLQKYKKYNRILAKQFPLFLKERASLDSIMVLHTKCRIAKTATQYTEKMVSQLEQSMPAPYI